MRSVIDLANSVAALQEPGRWLRWLNEVPVGADSPSPVREAVRSIALGFAVRRPLPVEEARAARDTLAAALRSVWAEVWPLLELEEAGSGTARLRSRIWFTDKALEAGPDDPDAFLALAFFFFLLGADGGPSALRVCDDCERYFIDRSRAQRGRFCSSACRGRGFRKGLEAPRASGRAKAGEPGTKSSRPRDGRPGSGRAKEPRAPDSRARDGQAKYDPTGDGRKGRGKVPGRGR